MKEYELAIIGSGPAALTAAIYTGRADIKTVIISGNQPGGLLTTTGKVENFPGFPEGIEGPELMERMRRQADKFGAEIINGEVKEVDFDNHPFILKVGDEEIHSHSVIIATGAVPRTLGIKGEDKLWGKGVSSCATCDGFFFKDQNVIVIGGGDTAIEDANHLSRFAKKVTIVHRRDQLRATPYMQQIAFDNPKIDIQWDTVVTNIKGAEEGKVTGVTFKNVKTNEEKDFPCDGVFLAVGHIPKTDIFKGKIDLDETGFIKADGVKTTVKGVFAAGDCKDSKYRQAITAAGSGCEASIEVQKYLQD